MMQQCDNSIITCFSSNGVCMLGSSLLCRSNISCTLILVAIIIIISDIDNINAWLEYQLSDMIILQYEIISCFNLVSA